MGSETPGQQSVASRARPGLRLLPLYGVVFMGFVGYSLMITIFTPLLLRDQTPMLPAGASISLRTIALGVLLCLYPLGQFVGSPVLGSLSDRYGRKPVLVVSLVATTLCYGAISRLHRRAEGDPARRRFAARGRVRGQHRHRPERDRRHDPVLRA